MLKKLFIACALSLILAACSSPPTKEQVKESVKRIIPVNFEVLQINPLQDIPGLFEVVLRANNQTVVLYVDQKAKYVISGSLMALDTKTNLTMESQKKYQQK